LLTKYLYDNNNISENEVDDLVALHNKKTELTQDDKIFEVIRDAEGLLPAETGITVGKNGMIMLDKNVISNDNESTVKVVVNVENN